MEKGKVTTTQRRNAQRKRRAEEISKSTTNDANLDNNLTLTSPQSLRPRPPNNETEQEELDTLDLKEWETCALKAFTNLFHENDSFPTIKFSGPNARTLNARPYPRKAQAHLNDMKQAITLHKPLWCFSGFDSEIRASYPSEWKYFEGEVPPTPAQTLDEVIVIIPRAATEARDAEITRLRSKLDNEQNRLDTLEDKLRKLQLEVEKQKSKVSGIKLKIGPYDDAAKLTEAIWDEVKLVDEKLAEKNALDLDDEAFVDSIQEATGDKLNRLEVQRTKDKVKEALQNKD